MASPPARVERAEPAYDRASSIPGEGPYYSHVEGKDAPTDDHYYNNIADPNYEDPEVNYENPDMDEGALGDDEDVGGSGSGSGDGESDGAGILPAARDTARFQQLGRAVQPQVDPGTVAFHGTLPAGNFGMQARGRVVLTSGEDILTIITVLPSDQPRKGAAALRMAKVLQQLAHPRIYRVLGVAVALERTLLLTEFTLEGTLQDHLRQSGAEVDSEERLTLARDVADALAYVSSRGLVHGDVRALNVLLVKGEARLTDFGQARTVSPERRGESLRWLAPELQPADKRTTAGDVFSFGILLLELFENCQLPYSDCTWTHIETHKRVAGGYRSACPVDMPEAIYNLCVDCWEVQPTGRPSFATVVARLNATGGLHALQHDIWTTASPNATSPLRTTPDHIPLLSGLTSPGKLNTRASAISIFSEESNDEWAYIARTGKLEHEPSETELAAAEDAYHAEQTRTGRSSRQSTRPGTAVSTTAADVLLAAGLQQSVGERSSVDHLRRVSQASYEDALNIAGFDTASMDAIPRLSSGNCSPMVLSEEAERRGSDDSVLATPSSPVAHGPCNYEDMADAHRPSQPDARKPSPPSVKGAPRTSAGPMAMSDGRASLTSSPLRPTPSPAFSNSRPTSPARARRLSRRASGLAPIIATNGDDDETYQYEEAMMGVIPEAGSSGNVELVQMPKAVEVQSHAYEEATGLDSDTEEEGEDGKEGQRSSSRSYSRTNSGIPPLLPAGNSTDILMAPSAIKLQNRLLQAADGSAATAVGALMAPKRQQYEHVQPTGGPGRRPLPAPPKRTSFMARVARGRAPSREYSGDAPIFYETEEQDVGPGSDYMTPRALLEPEWLHGVISRQEAETLVADQERGGGVPGAFLFRRKQEDDAFGITVLTDWDNVEHFLLVSAAGFVCCWAFENAK
jgi:serine/threonine protein kinase